MVSSSRDNSWPEYKNLVLEKFSRLEAGMEKLIELQSKSSEDTAVMKREILELHKRQDDFAHEQSELQGIVSEISKNVSALTISTQTFQSGCVRQTTHAEVFKQVNDSESGLLRRLGRCEEKLATYSKIWWFTITILIGAIITAAVNAGFEKIKEPPKQVMQSKPSNNS